jgi:LPS-assembly lipoprotein
MSIVARFAVVLVALALAACGFRLREEVALPAGFERVALDVADPFSPLARDLEAALERAGASIVPKDAEGAGIVRIPVNQMTTEVLTVGGTARVQEYAVRYLVEVEVVDGAGKVLLPRTPVTLEREYSFDETQALGAASEEALIRKELQREMVQQVLRRVEAAGR